MCSPCLPPLSVRYQARGIGCGTARRRERALSPARVRSGTNEWEGSSSWDPAQGPGCGSRQFPEPRGCCAGASPRSERRPRGAARTRRSEETHPAFVSAERLSVVNLHVYCSACRGKMEKVECCIVFLLAETFWSVSSLLKAKNTFKKSFWGKEIWSFWKFFV